MKKPLFAFATLLSVYSQEVFAAPDAAVIDVRRNIQMSESDPVYRDYYLNAGTTSGLKENLVVVATRKVSIKDSSGSQTYGEAQAPVAQLRIIYANERIAIAREYKGANRERNPMIEQNGVMIGDQIEIKGSFVDNKYPDVKTAEQKTEQAPVAANTSVKPAATATAGAKDATKPEATPLPTTAPAAAKSAAPQPTSTPAPASAAAVKVEEAPAVAQNNPPPSAE